MKRVFALLIVGLLLTSAAGAQEYDFSYDSVPAPAAPVEVTINHSSVSFQASLYPEYYKTASAVSDLRWVRRNDSNLVAFWEEKGGRILATLSELSGLDWIETSFDIIFLRYYPSIGNADPLVVPTGGMRRGILTEACPHGNRQQLNIIYQLAHRMLGQAERSEDPFYRSMTGHPLMQPGAFRRDNLAMLLALVTAQREIGLDSTFDAYQSAFWKQRHPGREIFEQYLLSEWILSSDHPLSRWVVEEPYGSSLVQSTRPRRRQVAATDTRKRVYVEGLPVKGQLGFSVKTNAANRLVVDKIDPTRLAFACGLREGDVIRRVEAARPRNHKILIERILAGLDEGGATLEIQREEITQTVLIQPLDLYGEDDPYYWQEMDDSAHYNIPTIEDSTIDPAIEEDSPKEN
ncbi:MAG: hypothetical protein GY867_03820 [bacterium]|nr:hypothetical protein [bacterium]